jgi:hypothetical protein
LKCEVPVVGLRLWEYFVADGAVGWRPFVAEHSGTDAAQLVVDIEGALPCTREALDDMGFGNLTSLKG